MPFYQVDNAGGAWTHALHIHADEINDDGNGPTSRTPARRASSYRVTALAVTALPRDPPTPGQPSRRLRHSRPATLRGHRHRQELGKSTTPAPVTFPPRAGERSQGSCVNHRNAEHMPGTSTWKWYRTVLFM